MSFFIGSTSHFCVRIVSYLDGRIRSPQGRSIFSGKLRQTVYTQRQINPFKAEFYKGAANRRFASLKHQNPYLQVRSL